MGPLNSENAATVSAEDAPVFQHSAVGGSSAAEAQLDATTRRTPPHSTTRSDSQGSTESVTLPSLSLAAAPPLVSPPPTDASAPAWRDKLRTKLYHRSAQVAQLQAALTQQVSSTSNQKQSSSQFILMSGPIGSGKTRLVQDACRQWLAAPAQAEPGYFLADPFDVGSAMTPYSAFCRALTQFVDLVLQRGPAEVQRVRRAIVAAVGKETQVLTALIPALAQILGDKPEDEYAKEKHNTSAVDPSEPTNNQAAIRFNFALRATLRALCSPDQPLVLFLDDLEYADNCSLDVLYSLVADSSRQGLVLVAACNDTSSNGYLASRLRDMEAKGTLVKHISVPNWNESQVVAVLQDLLDLGDMDHEELRRLSFQHTQGNVLFLISLLQYWQESDILAVDRLSNRLSFDADKARSTKLPSSSRALVLDQMMRLPQHTQDVLKVASCLTTTALNGRLIQFVLDFDVDSILCDLSQQGFLSLDESGTTYSFEHSEMQQAAYNLVPEADRARLHLEVGRRIWRKLSSEEVESHLFSILSQFQKGSSLIKREQEQIAVSTLCLHAAKIAAKASSFVVAASYLELGLELNSDPKRWRSDYDLMLALHNVAAEMFMCTGNEERLKPLLDVIFEHARTEKDKHQAFMTRISSFSYGERASEAIDLGVEVLKRLGETFPTRMCIPAMIREYKAVKKLLRGKSNEQLLRLPVMSDESKLQCLQILNFMVLPCVMERPRFTPFVMLKMMKITLQHGLSALSSMAFSTYGMLCIAAINDFAEATRFAKLSLVLLDTFKTIEYLPRVYAAAYGCTIPWTRPAEVVIEPLLKAYRVGLETGDIEFSALCSNLYIMYSVDTGTPLHEVDQRWGEYRAMMITNRQKSSLRAALPSVQLVHHLMGLTDDPLNPKGDLVDYEEFYAEADRRGVISSTMGVRYCRSMLCYYFHDYVNASKFCLTLAEIWMIPPTFERSSGFFFAGLVWLEAAQQGIQPRYHVREARKAIKLMKLWARQCPENFVNKVFLMQAELARVKKNTAVAYEKYVCAIALAQSHGLIQDAALSEERLALYLCSVSRASDARAHFEKAGELYATWGAEAKVRHVRGYMESLLNNSY